MIEERDYIARAIAGSGQIRAFALTTKTLTERVRRIHNYSPLAIAALGRVLSAALMLGDTLKGEKDMVTVFARGDGPIKQIVATADSQGHVKGYASVPDVDLPLREDGHLNVGAAIGHGSLTVIKDMGFGEPYVGTVQLVSGEIGDDLTYYFAKSEQTPTAVGLGVLVDTDHTIKAAGGFIVQLLPGASEEVISKLEKNLTNVKSVTDILKDDKTPEELIQIILTGFDVEFLGTKDVSFQCTCSKERLTRTLKSLGREELTDMLEKDGKAELTCDFCGKKHEFTADDLREIIASLDEKKTGE